MFAASFVEEKRDACARIVENLSHTIASMPHANKHTNLYAHSALANGVVVDVGNATGMHKINKISL